MDEGCDGPGVAEKKNEAVPRQELGRDMGSGAFFFLRVSESKKRKAKKSNQKSNQREREGRER